MNELVQVFVGIGLSKVNQSVGMVGILSVWRDEAECRSRAEKASVEEFPCEAIEVFELTSSDLKADMRRWLRKQDLPHSECDGIMHAIGVKLEDLVREVGEEKFPGFNEAESRYHHQIGGERLVDYLIRAGYFAKDAEEIARAYASRDMLKDAMAVIDAWDDDEHDYTGELACRIIDWERGTPILSPAELPASIRSSP